MTYLIFIGLTFLSMSFSWLEHRCYVAVTWWRRVSALTFKIVSRQLWLADDSWWPMEHFLCPESCSEKTIVTSHHHHRCHYCHHHHSAMGGSREDADVSYTGCWLGHNIHYHAFMFFILTSMWKLELALQRQCNGGRNKHEKSQDEEIPQMPAPICRQGAWCPAGGGSVWMADKCPT